MNCDVMFCCLSSSLSVSVLCPGPEFRVGRGPGWYEENPERHVARRECQSGQRQVQNPASDPPGQHQAAYWWVWVHVSRDEGWTQRWRETVSLVAMSTPHFPCKAQKPAATPGTPAFFSTPGEKKRLTGFVASASPKLCLAAFGQSHCYLLLRAPPPPTTPTKHTSFNLSEKEQAAYPVKHGPLPSPTLTVLMLACIVIKQQGHQTKRQNDWTELADIVLLRNKIKWPFVARRRCQHACP